MIQLLVLVLTACSDVGVVKHPVDDDSDGYSADIDCDDTHATANPDAPELCDGLDNDCDGEIDEDATGFGTWYPDADRDGFGDVAGAVTGCEAPAGFVTDGTDCDDALAAVNPAAAEVCGGGDEDCDGLLDEDDLSLTDAAQWYPDDDGDGHGNVERPTLACDQPEGYVATASDCDDADANVSPDAAEVCDAADVDEDCDGLADDADDSVDPAGKSAWHPDADGDTYGDAAGAVTVCDAPAGYVADAADCVDSDAAIHPAALEVCDDALDNNCDGAADEGCEPDDPGDLAFCDGANTGDSFSDGTSMGGPDLLLGMAFTPEEDMDIGRVEVFTGEGRGANSVAIWTDLDGAPDVELASGSWEMDTTNGWQGADLDVCVPVDAGTTYWAVWAPINGAQASWDTEGEYVSYRGSFDGGASWNGPYSGFVKFRLSCCE